AADVRAARAHCQPCSLARRARGDRCRRGRGPPARAAGSIFRCPRLNRLLRLLIAVLVAGGLGALAWYDTRSRIAATQDELARRLRDIESDAREARSV